VQGHTSLAARLTLTKRSGGFLFVPFILSSWENAQPNQRAEKVQQHTSQEPNVPGLSFDTGNKSLYAMHE